MFQIKYSLSPEISRKTWEGRLLTEWNPIREAFGLFGPRKGWIKECL